MWQPRGRGTEDKFRSREMRTWPQPGLDGKMSGEKNLGSLLDY